MTRPSRFNIRIAYADGTAVVEGGVVGRVEAILRMQQAIEILEQAIEILRREGEAGADLSNGEGGIALKLCPTEAELSPMPGASPLFQ